MWATLALAAVLQPLPAQANTLAIKNDRITYGMYGQERKENKFLAGDVLVISYDIEGLQVKADGEVQYSIGMELIDAKEKVVFKQEPAPLSATNTLGGSRRPVFSLSTIGLDTPPGPYTLKLTVTDRAAKTSQQLVRKFEVLPRKFGVVRMVLSNEGDMPVSPLAVPGQMVFVNFALVGFDLSDKKQPNLSVEMRVLDEKGQPTLPKPFVGEIKEVTEQFQKIAPMQFIVSANRSGKYTLELKATDKLSGKSVEEKLTLTVIELK